MKKTLAVLLCMLSIQVFSQHKNVTVKGKVLTDNVKEVKLYLNIDPISRQKTYISSLDKNNNFSIEVPVNKVTIGTIYIGRYRHKIYIFPEDNFTLTADNDDIVFKGKGGNKNNFLYDLEKNKISNYQFYRPSNKAKLAPAQLMNKLKQFKKKRIAALNSFHQGTLNTAFKKYFTLETETIYQSILRGYPRRYKYKNKIDTTLELPESYQKLYHFSYAVDDKKAFSSTYIRDIRGLLFTNFYKEGTRSFTSMEESRIAFNKVIKDSLTGKTREYVLANCIVGNLGRNDYESNSIELFNSISPGKLSKRVVNKSLDKYNVKKALLNKPLNKEFKNTLVIDSQGNKMTFGKMMKKFKGKVVYLDMWNMQCGPCRAAMPFSKDLKEKLKDEPIEFVYFYVGSRRGTPWSKIYETSLTEENHFLSPKGFESKLNRFMEINWVPNYMIFDKKGKLVSFSADRPTSQTKKYVTPIEKELRKLAAL
ncbi:TlpA family protein disulfide reductase [Wenyingzhuangia sp. IMCC45574]